MSGVCLRGWPIVAAGGIEPVVGVLFEIGRSLLVEPGCCEKCNCEEGVGYSVLGLVSFEVVCVAAAGAAGAEDAYGEL